MLATNNILSLPVSVNCAILGYAAAGGALTLISKLHGGKAPLPSALYFVSLFALFRTASPYLLSFCSAGTAAMSLRDFILYGAEVLLWIVFAILMIAPLRNLFAADGQKHGGKLTAFFCILLAFGMLFPNQQLFIIPIPVPIKAKWLIIGYFALEMVLALVAKGDGVAHIAHLGGMIFGFLLILYWRKHTPNNGYFGR